MLVVLIIITIICVIIVNIIIITNQSKKRPCDWVENGLRKKKSCQTQYHQIVLEVK